MLLLLDVLDFVHVRKEVHRLTPPGISRVLLALLPGSARGLHRFVEPICGSGVRGARAIDDQNVVRVGEQVGSSLERLVAGRGVQVSLRVRTTHADTAVDGVGALPLAAHGKVPRDDLAHTTVISPTAARARSSACALSSSPRPLPRVSAQAGEEVNGDRD